MASVQWDDDKPANEPAVKWDEPPKPDARNIVTRGYEEAVKPVTAVASTIADYATGPLVFAERLRQGEPLTQVLKSYGRRDDINATQKPNPLATVAVPQTPMEFGMQAGAMAFPPLAAAKYGGTALANLATKNPVLTRILAPTAGGALGDVAEGGTGARGAAWGAGAGVLGETIGSAVGRSRQILPGAKGAIESADTRRFGQFLNEEGGVSAPLRRAEDFTSAATGAFARKGENDAADAAAMEAWKRTAGDAKRTARQATREGNIDRKNEIARREHGYQDAASRARSDAKDVTELAKAETKRAYDRTLAGVRERQAEGVVETIRRTVPQLGGALSTGTGTSALRTAGAGAGRKSLGGQKEAVTRELESAVPEGLVIPSLSKKSPGQTAIDDFGDEVSIGGGDPAPIPVRDVLEALSVLATNAKTQFRRHKFDRDIGGRDYRAEYGELAEEFRQALNAVRPGLADVYMGGQTSYKGGINALEKLIERDALWGKDGAFQSKALGDKVMKPRFQAFLKEKVGDDAGEQIIQGVQGVQRTVPKHAVPKIEPVLPPRPPSPLAVAPTVPDIPPKPTPRGDNPADSLMALLFGPKHVLQDETGSRLNIRALQDYAQQPDTAAELTKILGAERAGKLLSVLLRGAKSGADVPSRGKGGLLDAARDWASGRNPGGGAFAAILPRTLFPNLGARYVGDAPMRLPAAARGAIDVGAQRLQRREEPRR